MKDEGESSFEIDSKGIGISVVESRVEGCVLTGVRSREEGVKGRKVRHSSRSDSVPLQNVVRSLACDHDHKLEGEGETYLVVEPNRFEKNASCSNLLATGFFSLSIVGTILGSSLLSIGFELR